MQPLLFTFPFSFLLSHLATRLDVLSCGYYAEAFVEINGREYHTLALDTHHLAWREIGNEEDALAYKHGGVFVESGYTAEDGAVCA